MNASLQREALLDLCERLGHDPNRVAYMTISPTEVEVTYVHPITEPGLARARTAEPVVLRQGGGV